MTRSRLVIVLALLAAANLAVLVIRVVSLHRGAVWLQMPNAEAMNVYALWKLRNGYPLYESAGRPFLPFTPYNFLFYYTYAAVMWAFRIAGPGLSFWARIPTLVSACLGAWILYRTAVSLSLRLNGTADRPLIALVSFSAWLGCGIVGWSALAVRPDVSAAALTLAAIAVSLGAIARDGRTSPGAWSPIWSMMLAASGLFAAAWAFKHSFIASFVGTVVFVAAVRRSVPEVLALVIPYAAVIGAALTVGSPGYYYAIFGVQSQDPVKIHEAQFWLRAGLLPNLMIWAAPAASIADLLRRWLRDRTRPRDEYVYLLALIGCVSGFTLLIIGKIGASEHYLIEVNVLGALWTGLALSAWAAGGVESEGRLRLAVWTAIPMLLFVLAVLTRAGIVQSTIGLRARGDRLVLGVPGELERRQAIARRMQDLPAPIYIDDQALAEPWFSNRGAFPAPVVVVEPSVYTRGLTGVGVHALIAGGYFHTLLLHELSTERELAARMGYVLRDTIPAPAGGLLEIYSR